MELKIFRGCFSGPVGLCTCRPTVATGKCWRECEGSSVIRVAPLITVVQFTQGSVPRAAYFAGLVCHAAESGLVFGCEQVKPGRNVGCENRFNE